MLKEEGEIDDDIIKKGYRRPGRASVQACNIQGSAFTIRRGLQKMTKKDGWRSPNTLFVTLSPLVFDRADKIKKTCNLFSRFEKGQLGDKEDYFEWSALFQMYKRAIERLEMLKGVA